MAAEGRILNADFQKISRVTLCAGVLPHPAPTHSWDPDHNAPFGSYGHNMVPHLFPSKNKLLASPLLLLLSSHIT